MTRLAVFFYSARARARRPGALDAGHRHRHREAGRRRRSSPAAARRRPIARIKAAGITFFTEGAHRLLPRQQPRGAVQPVRAPQASWPRRSRRQGACRADYLPLGAEKDLPKGSRPAKLAGALLRRPHHELALPRRQVRQQEHLRRRRRPSSGPTTCWCCGCRRATPATSTRPATRCRRRSSPARARRCSSTAAGSCAAPGRSRGRRRARCADQGRRADGPGRPHLDRAGAGATGGNVTFRAEVGSGVRRGRRGRAAHALLRQCAEARRG